MEKNTNQVEKIVEDLRRLIEEADRARAADPLFLRDLCALANRYTNPWRKRLVYDDFGDGDYTRSPAWTVTAGEFFIDRTGLVSRTGGTSTSQNSTTSRSGKTDAKDVALGVLATILSQQLGGQKKRPAAITSTGGAGLYKRGDLPAEPHYQLFLASR